MHAHVNSQGKKQGEKSSVLSLFLKVDREGTEVTLGGRLFQARAAATGKARSPNVESLVRGTSSAAVDVDQSLRISLAILSRLSRFSSPAVGTNGPFCVDVLLNNQPTNCVKTNILLILFLFLLKILFDAPLCFQVSGES